MIGRCLYGVDLNPMAVELCKVSLWIEALEPGKPLSFLDHHVQQGNSLLGTTPALMARGIPDTAFDPIEGDDKKVCAALRKKNKAERAGQTSFAFDRALPGFLDLGNVAETLLKLDDSPDGSPDQVTAKAEKYAELVTGSVYENNRLLADTWCAAFFLPKVASAPLEPRIEITHDFFRRMRENPHATPWGTREEIKHLAALISSFIGIWRFRIFSSLVRRSTTETPRVGSAGSTSYWGIRRGNRCYLMKKSGLPSDTPPLPLHRALPRVGQRSMRWGLSTHL